MTETLSTDVPPGVAASPPAAPAKPAPLSLGAISWSMFEGARDPFVILITIYIFMPYFANVVVGDPVAGQAAVARIGQWSGWTVALTAPFLGASIDRLGPRKPWLGLCVLLMVPMIWALWWTKPDHSGISIGTTVALAVAINVLFAYTEVFHNAMLMRAAGARQAHAASGLALAAGNGMSVLMMVFVLWAFVLPGKTNWSFIPAHPLFGLDPAMHEPDRIVAPIVAVLFVLGAVPLFLFTPDAAKTGIPPLTALAQGTRATWSMIKSLSGYKDAAVFLASRMIYVDGMTALLFFGGVYAAGVMRWGVLEMLTYGVLLSLFAVFGGFLGGWMDGRLGPKRAIQIEIVGALICLTSSLGMGREKILYAWTYHAADHAPVWNGPMFRTLPELVYLCIGFGTAVFVTGTYASSRTMLTRLTPAEQTGSFFGLYAMSNTATLWLGATLVGLFTVLFHSSQAGFFAIALLLVVGLAGLCFVKGGKRVH